MIKIAEKPEKRRIVVHFRPSWSSSYSRKMSSIGKAASACAIQQAIDHDTPYSYLENGVIVQSSPTAEKRKS